VLPCGGYRKRFLKYHNHATLPTRAQIRKRKIVAMKPIQDFEGYFTEEDKIFSMKPIRNGAKPPTEPRALKPRKDRGGYFCVTLHKDGKPFTRRVARLILETSVGPCPEGMEACHNNGIKTDNRPENLRWDTRKNNLTDRILHGTLANGEKNGQSKLNEMQIHIIRRYAKFGISQRKIAKKFGVSNVTISHIVRRKIWNHIL
jgi:hypothetical protein